MPAEPPLRAAECHLLQLFRTHFPQHRGQLLLFKQGMQRSRQLHAGHQALLDFRADYEVRLVRLRSEGKSDIEQLPCNGLRRLQTANGLPMPVKHELELSSCRVMS